MKNNISLGAKLFYCETLRNRLHSIKRTNYKILTTRKNRILIKSKKNKNKD